ncbi:MAG TPA: type II toxin-antitoxin system HicB family antitoxin [Phycisphaerales bacterium]|nr:type II toxin-antitoxin system HicB family antitoxin [Phycisphaerales bacterium]
MKKLQARIERYTYRVTWSQEDGEYLGLCAEFPSLSFLAVTRARALAGISRVVQEVVGDMQANGESIPEPLGLHEYSGKFVVRVPPHVHRRLAMEAAEGGISLNRLVSDKLSYEFGR